MTEEIPDITGTEADQQPAIEKAFTDSGLHQFNGFDLQPWTLSRKVAAQAMGMFIGNVDEAGRSRFATDKVYPGALRDVIVMLWLCTLKTESEVDAAARGPTLAIQKAYVWAAQHGLDGIDKESFWKAYAIFWDIRREVAQSEVIPEKKTDSAQLTAIHQT